MLSKFEYYLKGNRENTNDFVQESVIVLLGSLASHLEKGSPKIKPIVARLMKALSTPSQPVGSLFKCIL